MSQTPPPPRSPMERQGALIQDLVRVLLSSLDLPDSWARVGAAFIPHGEGWAGRLVITDRVGTPGGGDTAFAADSRITLLLDALQQAAAEQRQAFLSFQLEAVRSAEDPERIRLETDMNYDRDPGSFGDLGGVDAAYARRLAAQVGKDQLPGWVQELLGA